MKLLHLAQRRPVESLFRPAFVSALEELGALELVEAAEELSESERAARIRECDVLLTGWGSCAVPEAVAADPGRLRYICHLTGTLANQVPDALLDSGIPITNWGDAPAQPIAEGALALLLACLKEIRNQIRAKEIGDWLPEPPVMSRVGTLEGLRIGIYGCGMIGQRFIRLCQPFEPVLRVFDPFIDRLPEGVGRASDLRDLFAGSDAVVIHAGLTPDTRLSVGAELLSLLPDGGIVINTARGGIVDQAALFAELETGRLRAGLDVLGENDRLEPGHPARSWPNLILTAHKVGAADWFPRAEDRDRLAGLHRVALDNLKRFRDGRPLRFQLDRERLQRTT
jgi:phosphoglycerate dehydrogenase-like enzyme